MTGVSAAEAFLCLFRIFEECFGGGNHRFGALLLVASAGGHVFAAGNAFGLVGAARDIDGDVHPYFGMQHYRNGE